MNTGIRDALDLVCQNMQETDTNNKKTFAKWKSGLPVSEYAQKLLDLWTIASPEDQERLAIAYPQLAGAMLDWSKLNEASKKQGDKYIKSFLK